MAAARWAPPPDSAMNSDDILRDRYRGAMLGLACGDAVGTTVEFSPRGSFEPLTDMVGGGPFKLAPGQWTDDTSMALCLAESLVQCQGFDALDQMQRYLRWWQHGYLSSTGECFDIGMTVREALMRFASSHDPFAGSSDPRKAGNGALMRLAPAVLAYHRKPDELIERAVDSTRTTHAAPEAIDCSKVLAWVLHRALSGVAKGETRLGVLPMLRKPKVGDIAQGEFLDKPITQIAGTGYCVASLEAALWCVAHTETFRDAILVAANLGDDADTTAAIVGQIAGVLYGARGIPQEWIARLHMREEITRYADDLLELALKPS